MKAQNKKNIKSKGGKNKQYKVIEKLKNPSRPISDLQILNNALQNQQEVLELQNDELRRVGAELEYTRQKYYNLFDLAPVGYLNLNLEYKIVEANLTAANLFKIQKKFLINKLFIQLIDKDYQDIFLFYTQKLIKTKGKEQIQIKLKRNKEDTFWALVEFAFNSETEMNASIIVTISDITENIFSQEKINKQTAMLGAANDAIIGYDKDYRVTYWNPSAEKLYGYKAGETIGKYSYELLKPEYTDIRHEELISLLEDVGHIEVESLRTAKNGKKVLVESHVVTLRDNKEAIKGYIAVDRNITLRKQKENELRRTRDYLDNLINYANAPIICWSPELRITLFNHAFEKMTGYTADEVLGKDLSILFSEDAREESLKKIEETLVGKWEAVEIPILSKDGKIRIALWNSANVYSADGKIIETTIAQGQDITERKKAEEEMLHARDELEKRVQERTAELLKVNEQLKEENRERILTEKSLRLEEARLEALLRLSQMSEASYSGICNYILEQGIALTQSKIGFVGFLNEDASIYTLSAISKDVVKECNVQGDPMQWDVCTAGIWADAIRERKTLFVNDYHEPHPGKKGLPEGHVSIERFMVVPVFDGKNIIAVAGVGNKSFDYNTSDERQITLLLAGMWNHIQKNRAKEALLQAHDELEKKVQQRTAELAAANKALQEDILNRKQMEEALRESESKYKSIVETANEGIITISPEGIFIYVNKRMADMLGYSIDELIGKPSFNFISNEYHISVQQGRKTLHKGKIFSGELKFRRKDGSVFWSLFNSSPIFNEKGEHIANIAMHTDITDRKKAEEVLVKLNEELEERVRQRTIEVEKERKRLFDVLETMPAMICLLTQDYHVAFTNRGFREKFGESEGRHCYEYRFGKNEPCSFCESYNVLKTGKPHSWEVKTLDGGIIAAYDFPFTDTDGTQMVLEMDLDITKQRQNEAELKKHRENLENLVEERTAEIRNINEELLRFNQAAVGRELRMIELKKEINELCTKSGMPQRYPLEFEQGK